MDHRAAYQMIMELQSELRYELQAQPLIADADYRLIKALGATYELQDYLANQIGKQHRTLEERLTEHYGKPVEEIDRIEGDEEEWT